MKKQFIIKPAQLLKAITKTVAKAESTNSLKFAFMDGGRCCEDYMLITGQSKPVFSL